MNMEHVLYSTLGIYHIAITDFKTFQSYLKALKALNYLCILIFSYLWTLFEALVRLEVCGL